MDERLTCLLGALGFPDPETVIEEPATITESEDLEGLTLSEITQTDIDAVDLGSIQDVNTVDLESSEEEELEPESFVDPTLTFEFDDDDDDDYEDEPEKVVPEKPTSIVESVLPVLPVEPTLSTPIETSQSTPLGNTQVMESTDVDNTTEQTLKSALESFRELDTEETLKVIPEEYVYNKKILETEILEKDIEVGSLKRKKTSMFDFSYSNDSHISIALDDDWIVDENHNGIDDRLEQKVNNKKNFFNKFKKKGKSD